MTRWPSNPERNTEKPMVHRHGDDGKVVKRRACKNGKSCTAKMRRETRPCFRFGCVILEPLMERTRGLRARVSVPNTNNRINHDSRLYVCVDAHKYLLYIYTHMHTCTKHIDSAGVWSNHSLYLPLSPLHWDSPRIVFARQVWSVPRDETHFLNRFTSRSYTKYVSIKRKSYRFFFAFNIQR